MTVGASLELVPTMRMVPTPALVAYVKLLALPGPELDLAVASELADNPALIQDEPRTCGDCGLAAELQCACWQGHGAMRALATASSADGLMAVEPVARVSWAEVVLRDLRLALPSRDAATAAAVVASLDERGYLTCDPAELAHATDAALADVARVVRVLRQTGPSGVGARDVRDCLLLQLERLAAQGIAHPLAEDVVANHLEQLGRGAVCAIARQLGVAASDVTAAHKFIRTRLQPRPCIEDEVAGHGAVVAARPDVAVLRTSEKPEAVRVEILEERRLTLRVDPSFRQLARDNVTVSDLVRRGDFFLARLQERWSTMRRITEFVVRQRPDLIEGVDRTDSVRLTRSDVAAALGLNPSTVSRATADRYVLLPSRRLLPYSAFFDGSLGVRSQLLQIIAAESRPLSDAELCDRLRRAGHVVARRTVAKYRGRLQVLPSTHR